MYKTIKMLFTLFALLILFFAFVVFLFLNFNPAFGAKANKTTNPKILNSPNFVDGKFVNLSKKAFYEPKRQDYLKGRI